MVKHDHLQLPIFQNNIERQKNGGGGGYKSPAGRVKATFSSTAQQATDVITQSHARLKQKFLGQISPSLIYEIAINQSVSPESFESSLSSMGIHVLSIAENKKGFWVVFSDDETLGNFKRKLETYGSQFGPKYDFFNAIDAFQDIPKEKKIGQRLTDEPLGDHPEFIDIELWRMTDPRKNEKFIEELRSAYSNKPEFRITDKLISKTFALIRVKITKKIFDEIIDFKEISRADRPLTPQFNPFQYVRPNIDEIEFLKPDDNAHGILIIDSGIISNHPMLENCIGAEENFQDGEDKIQDTANHGTAVAGCAAYGDIEHCLNEKKFQPNNWIFSAKVMYADSDAIPGQHKAIYDPEKLVEHQLKDAVEYFLSTPEYHIRVVNISFGNSNEVWHKHYTRQLPLAAIIDELAFEFPDVVFLVSTGNQNPINIYENIDEILSNYPAYFTENTDFRIINPATSALALTIGSISGSVQLQRENFGNEHIKIPISQEHQPSPFTRTGYGLNGMIKPELVDYGGNLILYENFGRITEDCGGKIPILNNQVTENILRYDRGTSFATPKVAHLAGKIANHFPNRSGNFIKNMLLVGASYPFIPDKDFYQTKNQSDAEKVHLSISGYGLSCYDRSVMSFNNRVVLWDEGQLGLNQMKVYSLHLPEIFFNEPGKKRIIVTLTFNPETRMTRGDSYLGNRMDFHLFHSLNPQLLTEKYGVIDEDLEHNGIPEELKKFKIDFFPGSNTRKSGCHQKAWKEYKRDPKNRPSSPISLVLLNYNKWVADQNREQDYCISVTFEHDHEIELYNELRANIQPRVRIDMR